MKQKASLSVLAAGTLWGTMGIFVRAMNAAGLAAMEVVELRILSGCLLVGLFLLLGKRELFRIRLRDLWCFFGTGIVSLMLFSYCYFTAMNHTSIAVAGVLLYTAPIFVMLMSLLLFRERLTAKKLTALALAFSGCVLVAGLGSGEAVSLPGLLLGLGAGFFYALYSIFGRYAVNRGYSSWTITFYTFLFCSLGSVFLTDWTAIGAALRQERAMLLWIPAMAVFTAFLPYVLYAAGLREMESSRASILASVEPVVCALVSVLLFWEPIGAGGIVGILLVLAAIAVLSLPEKRNISEHSVNNSAKEL